MVKGLAVGASKTPNSSLVNHNGNRKVRTGINKRIMTGNPIAAMVWVIAKVAPKPINSRMTNAQIAARRLSRLRGLDAGGETFVLGQEYQLLSDAVALERLHSHDEEETGHHALRNQVQDDEERACHCSEGQEALREVADSLLHDVVCHPDSFALVSVVFVRYLAGDAEGSGVERRLRDEAVGEWNA